MKNIDILSKFWNDTPLNTHAICRTIINRDAKSNEYKEDYEKIHICTYMLYKTEKYSFWFSDFRNKLEVFEGDFDVNKKPLFSKINLKYDWHSISTQFKATKFYSDQHKREVLFNGYYFHSNPKNKNFFFAILKYANIFELFDKIKDTTIYKYMPKKQIDTSLADVKNQLLVLSNTELQKCNEIITQKVLT